MVTGDPVSTSALGGALRSQALTLADHVADLEAAAQRATRRGLTDSTARERDLLTRTARELDVIGAALQSLSVTIVEGAARSRELDADARRHDLEVDDSLVVESLGLSRLDPATRLQARERLQELLNRVTAATGRDLARLGREVQRSGDVLASVSERARTGT